MELYTHFTICLPGKALFKYLYNCTQCCVHIALEMILARYFLIMCGTEFIVILVAVT